MTAVGTALEVLRVALVSCEPAHRQHSVSLSLLASWRLQMLQHPGTRNFLRCSCRRGAPVQGPGRAVSAHRDGCVASPFAASAATRSAAARSASSLTLSDSDSEPLDSPAELRGSGRRGRGRRGGRCRWHRGSLGLHNRARKVTEAHWQARAFRVPKRREVPYAKNKNSSRTWALVLPWNPSWVRVMTSMLTGRLTVVTQSDSHGDCNLTSEALCMATPEDMP